MCHAPIEKWCTPGLLPPRRPGSARQSLLVYTGNLVSRPFPGMMHTPHSQENLGLGTFLDTPRIMPL